MEKIIDHLLMKDNQYIA